MKILKVAGYLLYAVDIAMVGCLILDVSFTHFAPIFTFLLILSAILFFLEAFYSGKRKT